MLINIPWPFVAVSWNLFQLFTVAALCWLSTIFDTTQFINSPSQLNHLEICNHLKTTLSRTRKRHKRATAKCNYSRLICWRKCTYLSEIYFTSAAATSEWNNSKSQTRENRRELIAVKLCIDGCQQISNYQSSYDVTFSKIHSLMFFWWKLFRSTVA